MIRPGRPRPATSLACAITLAGVALVSAPRHAQALDENSTMSDWNQASVSDQTRYLEALGPRLTPSFNAKRDEILACLNLAGQSSAHANLPVAEIAKACAEAAEPSTAPAQQNDI